MVLLSRFKWVKLQRWGGQEVLVDEVLVEEVIFQEIFVEEVIEKEGLTNFLVFEAGLELSDEFVYVILGLLGWRNGHRHGRHSLSTGAGERRAGRGRRKQWKKARSL